VVVVVVVVQLLLQNFHRPLLLLLLQFSIHELLHYLRDQYFTFGPDRVRHQSAACRNA
jgi:hypothetical protein